MSKGARWPCCSSEALVVDILEELEGAVMPEPHVSALWDLMQSLAHHGCELLQILHAYKRC